PVPFLLEPAGFMIRNPQPEIVIALSDSLSGLDLLSVVLKVNGLELRDGDFVWNAAGGYLNYLPPEPFPPGDTLYFTLWACDQPDYCSPNCDSMNWYITIEPYINCLVHPNPFSPNNDGYNEIVIFDYPGMFFKEGKVSIFDIRNIMVWQKPVGPIDSFSDFLKRSWNGKDNSGKLLPEGIYIYIIEVDDKVVCNGTLILTR
ncbi:gliding motility-associated C-terminal domain-containing protein, partial [bacterium]|nr:gliding motility-associated C-terminal domain-containing protein [bacterium]